MIPWETLDRALTSDGSEMTLCRRGDEFAIRVDGQNLMNSDSHGSEEKLAVHGCEGLAGKRGARVLIGGLGMGFTTRAALSSVGHDAEVDVVELVSAVARWNRDFLTHLADAPLRDPRVQIIEGDVADTIANAEARYDSILLDVDNGPEPLTSFHNRQLYTKKGLGLARRALRPNGVLAVWSVFEDVRFTERLRATGFQVQTRRVRAHPGASRRHVLWLARVAGSADASVRATR